MAPDPDGADVAWVTVVLALWLVILPIASMALLVDPPF